MPSPFPGMDPYLEQSAYWSSFHSRLIVGLADAVESMLNKQYYVEVETRTYLSEDDNTVLVGIPDASVIATIKAQDIPKTTAGSSSSQTAVITQPQQVTLPIPEEINERYLEVREVGSDQVITLIEVLSPKNKRPGKGRNMYEIKRAKILSSLTHLIEIDFLRVGTPMTRHGLVSESTYSILVSRSPQRPIADCYGFGVRDTIPSFLLPLASGEEELVIDTQEIFDGIYERGRYGNRVDYTQPIPAPALSEEDGEWWRSHSPVSD